MPNRDNPLWINRNPGITAVIATVVIGFLMISPSYYLWHTENRQTNDIVTCAIKSVGTRDESSQTYRAALVKFFAEFSSFLRNIQDQTSAIPLLQSSEKAKHSLQEVAIVVNAKDLQDCLEKD